VPRWRPARGKGTTTTVRIVCGGNMADNVELILEQLARNRIFLGNEGLEKLRKSFIIVVGCGGVGSHCVSSLARSGVSNIRLVDFDQVSLSSLNRHAVATLADVGTPKVSCLRRRLQAVVPWAAFDCRNEMFTGSTGADLLAPSASGQAPSFVVDAIDNIDTKVALLAYCHAAALPVISSMGAGCKSDPTRVFIGDISTSTEDPLSRATRRRLRAAPHHIATGIPVVYSTEKPGPGKATLQPVAADELARGAVDELAPAAGFRASILPVLGTMPAIFGHTLAAHVICALAGYPLDYALVKGRERLYDAMLAGVQSGEEAWARKTMTAAASGEDDGGDDERKPFDAQGLKVPLTAADIGYVVEEVWRGRSAVSGVSTRLVLVRWRAPRGPTVLRHAPGQKVSNVALRDLVCLTKEEAARHEREVFGAQREPEEIYAPEVCRLVEERGREERDYEQFR
jgi:tRNA A37 threonylcarbamoyladenosine dehydratase